MNLIYGVTVSNELEEINRLLNFLSDKKKNVIIQYDSGKSNNDLIEILKKYEFYYYGYEFRGNFSDFKNKLNETCQDHKADYIFQLDADEMLSDFMINNIENIITLNPQVDLYYVPRINTVDGLTDEYIKLWKWSINEKNRINFPDWQGRIFKSHLKYYGNVHERIIGFKEYSMLPTNDEFCILHHKKMDRQIKQNELYSNL